MQHSDFWESFSKPLSKIGQQLHNQPLDALMNASLPVRLEQESLAKIHVPVSLVEPVKVQLNAQACVQAEAERKPEVPFNGLKL